MAVAAWVAVAALVAVLIGRVVRRRDQQVPGRTPVGPGRAVQDRARVRGVDEDPAPLSPADPPGRPPRR